MKDLPGVKTATDGEIHRMSKADKRALYAKWCVLRLRDHPVLYIMIPWDAIEKYKESFK